MSESQPILLRPGFLKQAREKTRTHVFLAATFSPGVRTGMTPPKGARICPTALARVQPGDRLWVQEEIAALVDARRGEVQEAYYKLELRGGHVPIPGGAKGDKWRTKTWEAHKMTRENSRYTLEVTGARICHAQDITWDEASREGTLNPYATLGAWWGYQYGLLMPWYTNPRVISLDFTFTDGNIDTGERWEIPKRISGGGPAALDRIYGTRPVND